MNLKTKKKPLSKTDEITLLDQSIVGEHPSICKLRALVNRVAQSPARTVIIYGETGTGKGIVARMLHTLSSRKNNEFVEVNCAAIPANLLESELFGYEAGAFTDARGVKMGLVEAADHGTIFLDEIRELDGVLQAKLLTLLDTHRFRRVGSVSPISVDVRFISSTNKILLTEVKQGHFREDLYYRLQVVAINVPSLRDRGDDVLVLTDLFRKRFSELYGRDIGPPEPAVVDIFRAYTWPGNVRELENLLERIFIIEEDDRILVKHIPPRIMRTLEGGSESYVIGGRASEALQSHESLAAEIDIRGLTYHEATQTFQRRLILDALAATSHSFTAAAELLGMTRHALRHQMQKLRI